jgi:primosomal replication protein N
VGQLLIGCAVNQIRLSARIEQIVAVRYTPAGVPVTELQLAHESEVMEAGAVRTVRFNCKAMALGVHADALACADLTASWQFEGFLAASRNGKSVVFHIQDIHRI